MFFVFNSTYDFMKMKINLVPFRRYAKRTAYIDSNVAVISFRFWLNWK